VLISVEMLWIVVPLSLLMYMGMMMVGAEVVTVEIEVGGENYEVKVELESESSMDAAVKFCTEHRATFKLASEDAMREFCATPVSQVIQQALDQNAEDIRLDKVIGFTEDGDIDAL